MSGIEDKIALEIVTPAEILYTGVADSLVVSAYEGSMGVLPDHAPLVAVLKPGQVRFRSDGNNIIFNTSDGFLEIGKNKVRVIVESAEAVK